MQRNILIGNGINIQFGGIDQYSNSAILHRMFGNMKEGKYLPILPDCAIEQLKIWRGERYNAEGEKQISEYLDYWNLNTGYMLSFNFNKNKEQGVKRVEIGDKVLFEGTV